MRFFFYFSNETFILETTLSVWQIICGLGYGSLSLYLYIYPFFMCFAIYHSFALQLVNLSLFASVVCRISWSCILCSIQVGFLDELGFYVSVVSCMTLFKNVKVNNMYSVFFFFLTVRICMSYSIVFVHIFDIFLCVFLNYIFFSTFFDISLDLSL